MKNEKQYIFKAKGLSGDSRNKWVIGSNLKIEPNSTTGVFPYTYPHKMYCINDTPVDRKTICQYINRTDKDGLMIFEGDLLKENGRDDLFLVEFDEDKMKYQLRNMNHLEIIREIDKTIGDMENVENIFD